ncbi:MAG TPA: alpha/beta hydrolase-fold protein [Frankiaceae bacterium]|nr:alpha/beta hydrolase-fold protein [Frankiaceae bacterium]
MGSLVITDPAFLCGLGALALGLWVGFWLLVRRHHRVPGVFVAVIAVLLSVSTAADVVNAHYGYLPRFADVVGKASWPTANVSELTPAPGTTASAHPRGAVVSLPLPDATSGFGRHSALVYLPPQYFSDPERRFPVVYLLHGSPGIPVDWFRSDRAADVGLAAAKADRPVILVAPRMSRRWSDDSECVDSPQERVETYFTADVVPGVDHALRTVPTRAARTLAGNSAGGYCALNLGLRHRQQFGTIIDMSGYTRPTYNKGMQGLFGPRPDLAQVVEANTPSSYAPSLSPEPSVRIWFDVGRADRVPRGEISAIVPVLLDRGQLVWLHLRPGGHVHQVWRPALRQSVLWAVGAPAEASARGVGPP